MTLIDCNVEILVLPNGPCSILSFTYNIRHGHTRLLISSRYTYIPAFVHLRALQVNDGERGRRSRTRLNFFSHRTHYF